MKQLIKTVLFLVLLFLTVSSLQSLFEWGIEESYQNISGFYREEKNTLDAVYIGASTVHEFWQGPLAWKDHGIAVYSFAAPSMPTSVLKYMIIEAHKTQPNALMIIGVNNFRLSENDEAKLHFSSDHIPFSANKIAMVRNVAQKIGLFTLSERLEFYFPMIRYHSKWSNLTSADFTRRLNGLKGAATDEQFYREAVVTENNIAKTSERKALDAEREESLRDLLDCCHALGVNVLFVISPQMTLKTESVMELNAVSDIIHESGFPILNLTEDIEKMGLDLSGDFYNPFHTNVHGAIKFTEYLSKYLIEHYGFKDKRGNPMYRSWNEAAEKFTEIIMPFTFDFEREHQPMNLFISAPKAEISASFGNAATIRWKKPVNADGCVVYRKTGEGLWECLGTADESFMDSGLIPGTRYVYTIIPYRKESDGMVYGGFDRKGIIVDTEFPAPELLEVRRDESGIIISWAAVSGVNDYRVYRRTEDAPWIEIASSVKDLYYVDSGFIPGEIYYYTVSAYTNDIQGYRDPEGLSIITEAKE